MQFLNISRRSEKKKKGKDTDIKLRHMTTEASFATDKHHPLVQGVGRGIGNGVAVEHKSTAAYRTVCTKLSFPRERDVDQTVHMSISQPTTCTEGDFLRNIVGITLVLFSLYESDK